MSRAAAFDKCACHRCPNPATETQHSPYMDDFCDDCTSHRCDVAGHGAKGIDDGA